MSAALRKVGQRVYAGRMKFVDGKGREYAVTAMGGQGWTIENGVVNYWTEDADGNREEWSEPLCQSPVRDVFAPWTWDLIADPRYDSLPEP